MILLSAMIILLSFFEVRAMIKKGQKKEIAIFTVFALLALLMGYFKMHNKYGISFAQFFLKVMGKSF